jgi:AraC-like DNA-binding protein
MVVLRIAHANMFDADVGSDSLTSMAGDNMTHFRSIRSGEEELPANFHMPRHRHLDAYATVVLRGAFEEAGYAGRIIARPGDLLIHPVLDCHIDRMVTPGISLLRIPWPNTDLTGGLYRIDLDLVARVAEKDLREAEACILSLLANRAPLAPTCNDWPDLLAAAIKQNSRLGIGQWAERQGLARETVSRGFSAVWGVSPVTFRAEWRARSAWLAISRGHKALSDVAAQTGFADQAHMTRWVGRITGSPPSVWKTFSCTMPGSAD